MPDVADTDVIRAFLSGTTYESLVHKLGCKGPWTNKELLDIMTSHASDEEAVGAIFDRPKGKAKQDEDADEGNSNRPPRVLLTTLRSYLRGHARTMPSPSSTYRRTVPS